MTNRQAACFKNLCDTVVACYPDVLRTPNAPGQLQPRPPTSEEWWLRPSGSAFQLVWSPQAAAQQVVGRVSNMGDVERLARTVSSHRYLRFDPHPLLSPIVPVWSSSRRLTRDRLRRIVRLPRLQRGESTLQARTDKLTSEHTGLMAGLKDLTWADINKLPYVASRHKLLLYRIKTGSISGWDRETQRRGCPHCPDAGSEGGSVAHIFWQCPSAQDIWRSQFSLWRALGLHIDPHDTAASAKAAFSLRLPRMPKGLWTLRAAVTAHTSADIIAIHAVMREAWRQHCIATIAAIWRWRCGPIDEERRWSRLQAEAYAKSTCRAGWALLTDAQVYEDSPPFIVDILTDLRELSLSLSATPTDPTEAPIESSPTTINTNYQILFFDGGSRGNPGPGGAGSVLVETDSTGAAARVSWCAAFSYSHPSTTNNYAEYQGVVEGLAEAQRLGWHGIHVVGDSQLILSQLRAYHPPKNQRLRSLYAKARRLADAVGVHRWTHHLRAYNKMADTAANIAMDHGSQHSRGHPTPASAFQALLPHLRSDIACWSEEWLRAARL